MTNIIVTCTTTSERLQCLYYMLESLRWQTVQPDAVVVNLSKEPYLLDQGLRDAPEWLTRFSVDVCWVENTGPYRKLLPTIANSSESDIVVTADDDIIYGNRWLEKLRDLAMRYPESIVAARGREMCIGPFGGWQNYRRWGLLSRLKVGPLLLPTGGAGAVYRRPCLDEEFLHDPTYLQIAPTCDDLWFRMASLLKKAPVVIDPEIDRDNIYLRGPLGLYQGNSSQPDSCLTKAYHHTIGSINAWLGINDTENDHAWDRICSYTGWGTS